MTKANSGCQKGKTHSFRNGNSGYPPWLSASNLTIFVIAIFDQKLSQLGCLSTTCLPNNNHYPMVINQFEEFPLAGEDWQILTLLLHGLVLGELTNSSLCF